MKLGRLVLYSQSFQQIHNRSVEGLLVRVMINHSLMFVERTVPPVHPLSRPATKGRICKYTVPAVPEKICGPDFNETVSKAITRVLSEYYTKS